jgi:hypothetical protein
VDQRVDQTASEVDDIGADPRHRDAFGVEMKPGAELKD